MRECLALLISVSLGVGVLADEKPVRDFTAVLKTICRQARIPDLSQAEPGKVEWSSYSPVALLAKRLRVGVRPREGGSWKLGANPDGSLRVLLHGIHEVAIYPPDDVDHSRLRGTWHRQREWELTQQAEEKVLGWAGDWENGPFDDPAAPRLIAGRLLFEAAQIYASGRHGEAYRLATVLLGRKGSRQVVLGSHYAAADTRCRSAFLRLACGGRRDQYIADLEAIDREFATGWSRRPGLQHVLRTMRASNAPPKSVAMLTPKDQGLVRALASGPPGQWFPGADRWLFSDSAHLQRAAPDSPPVRLLSRGMAALPVLFAMLDDPRPTAYISTQLSSGTGGGVVSFGGAVDSGMFSLGSDDEKLFAHMGLPHLMTGRELALRLLVDLWGYGGRFPPPNPEKLVTNTKEWYGNHQGLPPKAAMTRLFAGKTKHAGLTVQYLLNQRMTVAEYSRFEEAMLRLNLDEQCFALSCYAIVRGEEARSIVERAIAREEANPTDMWGDEESWCDIEDLKRLLPSVPAEKEDWRAHHKRLLKAMEQGDEKTFQSIAYQAYDRPGCMVLVGELLERQAEGRSRLPLHCVVRTLWELSANRSQLSIHPSRRISLDRHRDAWQKILSTSPIDPVFPREYGHDGTALQFFLSMYESPDPDSARHPGNLENLRLISAVSTEDGRALPGVVASFLDNPALQPTPWPNPRTVSRERREEILTMLARLPTEEARLHALALRKDEYVATVNEVAERRDLADRLLMEARWTLPACRFIGEISPSIAKTIRGFSGRRLSRELGWDLIADGMGLVKAGHPFLAVFEAGPGLVVRFEAVALDPAAREGTRAGAILRHLAADVPGDKGAGIHLFLGRHRHGFWPVPNGNEEPVRRTVPEGALPFLYGSHEWQGGEQGKDELLWALDGVLGRPNALLSPCGNVSLMVVGVDEPTGKRLRTEAKKTDRR
jgi:hypothetical protein